MTALECASLLVSETGSPRLAEDSCARIGNPPRWTRKNSCSCSSETARHSAVTTPLRDQAAQMPLPATLRTVKSP